MGNIGLENMARHIFLPILVLWLRCVCILAACLSGWFGSNCQYKCHCIDNNCDINGLCLDESTCASGWFGPLCQYQDLAQLGSTSTTILTDRDDTTCANLQYSTINLARRYELTSIRVKLKADELRLAVKETVYNSSFTPCTGITITQFNDSTRYIYCSCNKTVQMVQIDFGKTISLCTVNINGGRNVALKQMTWQSSDYGTVYTSDKAVDGNTDNRIASGSCTHTEDKGIWGLTFPIPLYINRYILYNRGDVQFRLRGFTLTSYNFSQQIVFTYTDPNLNTDADVYIVTSPPTPSVYYVEIRSTSALTLCEVEVFEACPFGWFGPSCQYKCHCTNNYCDVSGGCYGGSSCDSGWFGPLCQNACPATFYGDNCTHKCSTHCLDQTCENVNGKCVDCISGRTGEFCEQDCDNTHYGPGCIYTCSTNCENLQCDSINGQCKKCLPGYTGHFCNTTFESNRLEWNCNLKDGRCYNCTEIYQEPSKELCHERLIEGIGIGIGITCAAVVLITAIVCIICRCKSRKLGNNMNTEAHTKSNENLKESQTANNDQDIPSTKAGSNPYDDNNKENGQYENFDPDYKEIVEYESIGMESTNIHSL
ncbi:uncharacterized protein LOC131942915 isoform X2 [Physella acuta]|uniref:uncharacterized protein LOC131942915 isoform X2 n=1 Tax=Physella acuta TaxID=109671 RepID=UPI0027DBC9E9|nr:uncharacterized protein LOC131942915 isoform X2 [Physella acuta]